MTTSPTPPATLPATRGELSASGHEQRTVKQELRENVLERLRTGEPTFPGMVGFDDTVVPDVE
ncbi:MAG TPA: magnesium chelatase, partial [Actinomycetes bacterium]|nr:magnesium chelatase [Actinomycetes bacterium]